MNACICELLESTTNRLLTSSSHIQSELLHNRNVNELMNMLTQPTNQEGQSTMDINNLADIIQEIRNMTFVDYRELADYLDTNHPEDSNQTIKIACWNYIQTGRVIL